MTNAITFLLDDARQDRLPFMRCVRHLPTKRVFRNDKVEVAQCSPMRAAHLTGQNMHRAGN
jgi:hypothetical protein